MKKSNKFMNRSEHKVTYVPKTQHRITSDESYIVQLAHETFVLNNNWETWIHLCTHSLKTHISSLCQQWWCRKLRRWFPHPTEYQSSPPDWIVRNGDFRWRNCLLFFSLGNFRPRRIYGGAPRDSEVRTTDHSRSMIAPRGPPASAGSESGVRPQAPFGAMRPIP